MKNKKALIGVIIFIILIVAIIVIKTVADSDESNFLNGRLTTVYVATGGGKEDFLLVLMIRDGTENRAQQGHDDCDNRDGDGIIGGRLVAGNLPRRIPDCQGFEPDGNQRTGQHRESGIPHVIEHPRFFLLG